MADNLLQKIKKTKIPNTYYALVSVAFVAVIGVVYMVVIGVHHKQVEQVELEPAVKAKLSSASKYVTSNMDLDMSRKDVIRALGIPTWAVLPTDDHPLAPPNDGEFGLELHWSNPACRDVVVLFSPPPYEVIGWDDGAGYCGMKEKHDYSALACTREDRRQYCR